MTQQLLQTFIENFTMVGLVLKTQHPTLLNEILESSPLNPSGHNFTHESIFLAANGLTTRPKCLVCGIVERRFHNIKKGYVPTCPKCKGKSEWRKERFKTTCLAKFGSSAPAGNPAIMKRIYETKVQKGLFKTKEDRSAYKNYSNEVYRITYTHPIHSLDHFEKRGKAGVDGAYQIDHQFSIYDGFRMKVCPTIVGHIQNLKMLPVSENRQKWHRSAITLEDLLERIKTA